MCGGGFGRQPLWRCNPSGRLGSSPGRGSTPSIRLAGPGLQERRPRPISWLAQSARQAGQSGDCSPRVGPARHTHIHRARTHARINIHIHPGSCFPGDAIRYLVVDEEPAPALCLGAPAGTALCMGRVGLLLRVPGVSLRMVDHPANPPAVGVSGGARHRAGR